MVYHGECSIQRLNRMRVLLLFDEVISVCYHCCVRLFVIPWTVPACLPGTSVHGILQVRILKWVAIPFSRESSWPRDQTEISRMAGRFFTIWATGEALVKSLKDVNYIHLIDGVDILIFCLLNLFIPNRGVLKSSTITMESSVYPSSSNSFCFMNFNVLLLYTYLLRIILLHFHALEKEMVIHSKCSCLENPRDRGSWWAAVYGVAQSRTRLKWLSSSSSIVILYWHFCHYVKVKVKLLSPVWLFVTP